MLLVGYIMGIRSERRLCEEVHLNLAYRWFYKMDLTDVRNNGENIMIVTTVDKSFGYKKDETGTLRIVLHHSSLPYQP